MTDPRPVPLLGRLAVHLKMISMDQLAEAIRSQGRAGEDAKLGEVMVSLGLIDRAQLAKLIAAQQQVIAKQKKALPVSGPAQAGARPALRPTPAPPAPAAAPAPRSAAPAPTSRAAAAMAEGPQPIGSAADFAAPSDADRARFEGILRRAIERGASDVHLHEGATVQIRIAGQLAPEGDSLELEDAERMVLSILSPQQRDVLAARGELDVCNTFPGIGRFRANLYRAHRGLDGVFRFISATPPTLDQLGLPARLAKFTTYHQGMVLVTGPSGCGKSSTMAALVNLINEERREHILTIEDPIEYVHASRRCLVNQRSAGDHTQSFARALRAALREDPDVIVIGELRDLETVSLALSAAETGHFVLATLHTDNAIRTVNRLVGSFPADQQDQVRTMMSESLRAVISQRLLPRADGQGRVAALETMVVTRAVANLIRENKTFQIHSILQTGASQGMALLDHSIRELVQKGVVKVEDAARYVEDAKAAAAA
ncbi:MAG TPA: PilT/PilU family type 4a pilus ATPase [Myxococcota bacterium]|nr:PilT/PilU family type 4a pilus ATPase [Myxococcota bacterium]